jgi:hypothetical protein
MWEIPHSYGSPERDDDVASEYFNTQIVPRRIDGEFPIPIGPGIGQILASTREQYGF